MSRLSSTYVVGVDLGGTKISVGAMPADGTRQIAMRAVPTLAAEGADAVVRRITDSIESVIAQTIAETGATRADFAGVGIGSPGPLDREQGLVITTPNLGWTNFPLRDRISEVVKLPGVLDNDKKMIPEMTLADVAAGQLHFAFSSLQAAMSFVRSPARTDSTIRRASAPSTMCQGASPVLVCRSIRSDTGTNVSYSLKCFQSVLVTRQRSLGSASRVFSRWRCAFFERCSQNFRISTPSSARTRSKAAIRARSA